MRILKNCLVHTFLVGLMMMAILLCCSSQVQAAQEGDYSYFVTEGKSYMSKYYGAGGSVTLPSTLGGFPVTSIEGGAFRGCKVLTSITIPQSVTSIGSSVFADCIGLTSITIPQSVTSIDYSAFYNCSGLTSITIPQGVTRIGEQFFYNCFSLTSITIPQGVTSIGYSAFYNCSGLTSITIPQGVTRIGDTAFYGCSDLTSITFNSATTEIFDNKSTILATTKIIGYASSTAQRYAAKYYRTFEVIGTTVDKTTLTTTITNATTLLASKTVGTAVGNVSQAAHEAYNTAITSATAVKNNAIATQAQVDAAVTALATATTTFNDAIVSSNTFPVQQNIPLNKEWRISFSQPVDSSTIQSNILLWRIDTTTQTQVKVDITPIIDPANSKVVIVKHSTPFVAGASYELTVNIGIKDVAGKSLSKASSLSFMTIAQ